MELSFTTGLLIGLLVGWIVEYAIDVLYWRRRNDRALRARLADVEMSLATANQHVEVLSGDLRHSETQVAALHAALSEANWEVENLRAQLFASPRTATDEAVPVEKVIVDAEQQQQ